MKLNSELIQEVPETVSWFHLCWEKSNGYFLWTSTLKRTFVIRLSWNQEDWTWDNFPDSSSFNWGRPASSLTFSTSGKKIKKSFHRFMQFAVLFSSSPQEGHRRRQSKTVSNRVSNSWLGGKGGNFSQVLSHFSLSFFSAFNSHFWSHQEVVYASGTPGLLTWNRSSRDFLSSSRAY